MGKRSATIVIVNVPPADDEQVTRVQEQENRKRYVHRLDDNLFLVAQQ